MAAVFNNIIRSLLGRGRYEQPPEQLEPDALSASVNLEDIINEYDEPSRISRNTDSVVSSSKIARLSQSYFSLISVRDIDETTSFYSALQDGFSLNDEHNPRTKFQQDFSWTYNNTRDRDSMLQPNDFRVSWHDLVYKIDVKPTLSQVIHDLQTRLTSSASSASRYLTRSSQKSSSCNINNGPGSPEPRPTNETITILQNINGSFKSSELTAIMGPSGAGKTSLLNFISRRTEKGFTGALHVSEPNRRISINAIPQHDCLAEYLTVRENLIFASRLKNPYNKIDHGENVKRVSSLLGLDECLDTKTKKTSGGQQKRVAIAQELLSKPDILILDEPTSGLDSLTCLRTLSVLKDLVQASAKKIIDPIAIVLTIHQPQLEAFNLFDKVYVMASGGIVIYDGSPNRCSEFIEKYSGLKLPAQDHNPASFLIEIASGEYGQEPIKRLATQVKLEFEQHFVDATSSPTLNQASLSEIKPSPAVSKDVINVGGGKSLSSGHEKMSRECNDRQKTGYLFLDPLLVKGSSMNQGGFFLKTRVLTKRCWLSLIRDPNQMIARILFHFLLPFAVMIMMGKEPGHANACPKYSANFSLKNLMFTDEYTDPAVQEDLMLSMENVAILFVTIYSCISANIAAMTLVFALDMKSSLKEYHNGWYSMYSYMIARLLSNIPLGIILPTLTTGLTYYLTEQTTNNGSLSDFNRILLTSLSVILGSAIGESIGMIFGSIYVGQITTALFAGQGATLPFVLLSGFVARTKNMTKFVRALSVTSLYKHCLEVTFIARYGFNVCECDSKNITNVPTLLGVPEELRSFVTMWMNLQEDPETAAAVAATTSTATSIAPNSTSSNTTTTTKGDDQDIFQVIAKQLNLYNMYGVETNSCRDIVPFQLYDFGLRESDLPKSFFALISTFAATLVILFYIVRLVINYRTSL